MCRSEKKILILSAEDDGHTQLVMRELSRRGFPFVVLDLGTFPDTTQLSCTINQQDIEIGIKFGKEILKSDNIQAIWYRRPNSPKISSVVDKEEHRNFAYQESIAFLRGLWDVLDCPIVSSPNCIRRAEQKLFQLKLARELGFIIPPTLITNDPDRAYYFFSSNQPIILKTLTPALVNYGFDNVWTAVYTTPLTNENLRYLSNVRLAPCIFQPYVPKKFELRITVVGQKIFPVEIHSQQSEVAKHDWRRYDLENTPHCLHKLPEEIQQMCLRLVQYLGLHFGCIDMIVTPQGEYVFLEINPNGNWGWIEEIVEVPITASLVDLLIEMGQEKNREGTSINL